MSVPLRLSATRGLTAISWQGEDYKPVVSVAIKKVPGQDSIKVIENAIA